MKTVKCEPSEEATKPEQFVMKQENLNNIFEFNNPSKQFMSMSLSPTEQGQLRTAVLNSFGPNILSQVQDAAQIIPDAGNWPAVNTSAL